MSAIAKLIGFGMRQVVGTVVGEEAGKATQSVVRLVEQHFTDHSQTLPAALARANDRAWQALGIGLAGDGFLDQLKVFFASGDDKGIREQVRLFLQDKNLGFDGSSADFRKQCLAELKNARQSGVLSANHLGPGEVAQQAANFQSYADPRTMVDGAERVMSEVADELATEFPNLGKLVRQSPAGGPPLLVAAFAYFFRREVETNDELAHGLFFDGLRQLSAAQAKALGEVNKALTILGDQFEQVFEQLGRIESVVAGTHGAVLDIQVELQRLGNLHLANTDEVRRLMQDVLNRVNQVGMQKGEVKPHHSFSIHGDVERAIVKQLLARFRQLPDDQQKRVPALLNGLGKLQFGTGDFHGARQTFLAVAKEINDSAARAEAQFNAYRAALEEKKWDAALTAIQQAASLDRQRFTPFPMERYHPKRLLGAGGFGAAFLCHDRNLDEEVVVKTLHDAVMERNMTDVFREAHVLRDLHHATIIRLRECNYTDLTRAARPYIVMDYFPGISLANFIEERGTISPEDLIVVAQQVAAGMHSAHQQNILHRDLKPDNILVRKEGSNWKVKIIDFGLALRKQTIETSMAVRSAGNTVLSNSVAGTIKYAPPEQLGEMKGVKPGPYSDVYSFGKMCCYALFRTTEPKDRHWKTVSDNIRTDLKDMMDQCREEELEHRLPNFEPVLKVLDSLNSRQTLRRKKEEARREAEQERTRQLQEETARAQRHLEEILEQAELDKKRLDEEVALRRKLQEEVRRQGELVQDTQEEEEESERQRKQLEALLRQEQLERKERWEWRQFQKEGESKLAQFVEKALAQAGGKPTNEDRIIASEICNKYGIPKGRMKQIVAETKAEWEKSTRQHGRNPDDLQASAKILRSSVEPGVKPSTPSENPIEIVCPSCQRVNPASAAHCYFDGAPLTKGPKAKAIKKAVNESKTNDIHELVSSVLREFRPRNARELSIEEARRLITDLELIAFLRAVRASGGMLSTERINESLDKGETLDQIFYDGDSWGYFLTVKRVSIRRFRIEFGCAVDPLAGEGGKWNVIFDSLGQVESVSGGPAWIS